MTRYEAAAEARRLRTMGEGMSLPAIARELNLTAAEVGDMLMWLPCETCFRPTPRRSRVGRTGPRMCSRCEQRVRRGVPLHFRSRGPGRGVVPVHLLVFAMVQHKIDCKDIALRLGWMCRQGRYPDGPRVRRTLGLRPDSDGHYRSAVDVRTATDIARAIDPDLVLQFGL